MIHLWVWCMLIGAGIAMDFFAPPSALSVEATEPATALTTPTVADEGDREKEAEELKRLQEFFLRSQSVFIRRGEVILEFNNFYNQDRRQELLQLSLGGAAVVETTRRIFESSLFARVGIATGLEVDVRVPYLVQADQTTNAGTSNFTTSSTGIGDVAVSLRYQAWYEKGLRPSIIFDVNVKSRTASSGLLGTGNYSVGGGVTLLKSIDPVYFFARVGYTETIAAAGRNLGNSFDYSAGMGFSLNDRVAFNMQYVGAQIGQVKINDVAIDNSSLEIGGLNFSATILITKKLFVEPTVGLGITKDAFDSIVGLRIPYRF